MHWREVWENLETGCKRASVVLDSTETMQLYESWDSAFDWECDAA